MNICCVICSDLFTPSAEVFVTKCGHMFHYECLLTWLEKKKTCPQCRSLSTEKTIHKVYFNIPDTHKETEDVGSLLNKVDSLKFQNRQIQKELETSKEKANNFKEVNSQLRQEIMKLEDQERTHKSVVLSLKDQISFFKAKYKECEKLSAEIVRLKDQIKGMENAQKVIEGTQEEVNNIIRSDADIEQLSLLVAILKKTLLETEGAKRDADFKLKKLKNDATRLKSSYSELECKYSDLKKEYDHLRLSNEKEKEFLKNKIIEIKNRQSCNESSGIGDSTLQSIVLESPINVDRTPKSKTVEKQPKILESPTKEPHHNEQLTKLKTKIVSLLSPKIQTVSALPNNKSSIFKSLSLIQDHKSVNIEVTYDGFGGSSKEDVFPSPKPLSTGLKRPKSGHTITASKIRKLAPIPKKR